MDTLTINPVSKASVEFDITRPLRFSRSATQLAPLDGSRVAYIYSRAVDGHNSVRVAIVSIANMCGLSEEQETALVDRIADEIVAPAFSEDEIEDIAYALRDAYELQRTKDWSQRARTLCDDITTRRRLNLSGSR